MSEQEQNKKNLKVSIFSPSYWKTNPYIDDMYDSLLEQTIQDWELIILLSNGGKVSKRIQQDKRVKIIQDTEENNNIGRLKKICCDAATNDILVELDADDMLTANAIEEIINAFQDDDVHFVYSNCAEFFDKTWAPRVYGENWGWRNKPFKYKDHELLEQLSFAPMATTMWRIEWAPNHVRCWRKTSYYEVGGHNIELSKGDDHDLICKTYLKYGDKGFHWINKCLYLYRVHKENSCVTDNGTVQEVVLQNYFKYSRPIATKWAQDNNLKVLDLGGRGIRWDEYEVINLEELYDLEPNSVGIIKCHEYLQFTANPVEVIEKIWEVLAHGGILFLEVPSTESNEAFANPLYKSYWNGASSKYYSQKKFAEEINFKGKFQEWRNATFYPTKYHEDNKLLITQLDYVAIKKDEPTLPGAQWI